METGTKYKKISIKDEFSLNFIRFLTNDKQDEFNLPITDDIYHAVLYLISKLEPREQQVVKLRFMERKSLDEIEK